MAILFWIFQNIAFYSHAPDSGTLSFLCFQTPIGCLFDGLKLDFLLRVGAEMKTSQGAEVMFAHRVGTYRARGLTSAGKPKGSFYCAYQCMAAMFLALKRGFTPWNVKFLYVFRGRRPLIIALAKNTADWKHWPKVRPLYYLLCKYIQR
jgi:hypothetical protein